MLVSLGGARAAHWHCTLPVLDARPFSAFPLHQSSAEGVSRLSHTLPSILFMAVCNNDAYGLAGVAAAVCVVAVSYVAARAVLSLATRARATSVADAAASVEAVPGSVAAAPATLAAKPPSLAAAPTSLAVAPAPLASAPGHSAVRAPAASLAAAGRAPPQRTAGGHRAAQVAATDGSSSSGATDGRDSGEQAGGAAGTHSVSVLLDYDTLHDLRRKLCFVCPCEVRCFNRRLSEEIERVVWGCFTHRGLVKMCLRGLGCPVCEEAGPAPRALVSFKKLIPHMVNNFWMDCYHKSNREEHNVCSEHSKAGFNDHHRHRTHALID